MAAIRRNWFVIQKTASYYVVHIAVAATVAYAITGDLVAALTLSLLEPTIQAGVFFVHEKVWQRAGRQYPSPQTLPGAISS